VNHGLELCVGIDPHYQIANSFFANEADRDPYQFLISYTGSIVEAAAGMAKSIKFQSAWFEARGHLGILALRDGIVTAKTRGLNVILDAKRGDIGSTMQAYGEFAFGYMNADAITINPFIGMSCIDGLSEWLSRGRSCFLVFLTSSGVGDPFQEAIAAEMNRPNSVFDAFLRSYEEHPFRSQIGLVVGAQRVDSLSDGVLERLKKFNWLVPGIGAQGGILSPRMRQNVSAVIAASRELCGDLSKPNLPQSVSIHSWSEYAEFVRSNIQKFKANYGVN
jgi:orotidine-5'-phosphate decarboxylase